MLEVESDKELLSCNKIVAREATLYLHYIYAVSTQYLHNIYTISTHYPPVLVAGHLAHLYQDTVEAGRG